MMLNSQRLSAMIDSFNSNADDEKILNINKRSDSTKSKQEAEYLGTPVHRFESPRKLKSSAGFSPANSADNRLSMISNYSGVVQEGVEVSYVVKSDGAVSGSKQGPSLPALPSQDDLENIAEDVPKAKSASRLNSDASAVSATSNYSDKAVPTKLSVSNSLRLLPVNRRQVAASSIGSGNLASESGSSYYQHIKEEEKRPLLQKINSADSTQNSSEQSHMNNATATDSSDNYSITTSIIQPLSTSVRGEQSEILPIRSETNPYNPTIPPRNKNRPRSKLFIRDSLDEIEDQLMEQMKDSNPIEKASNELTRTSSVTNKSDTYFSATSFQGKEDYDIHDTTNETAQEDHSYLGRPLPHVPSEKQVDRNSTIRVEDVDDREAEGEAGRGEGLHHMEDYEDQFEDIDESEDLQMKDKEQESQHKKEELSTKNSQLKRKKGTKKRQELRSFDVDTLSQLLNVTKGTLIGSEFANLGMKIEEKRALERLVDSLSRLTADMVLDPQRYEEGLKRLDKATRALEGF